MSEHLWTGPDGADPLGFLATLGAFRVLALSQSNIRLSWKPEGPRWRPCLHGELGQAQILALLAAHMKDRAKANEFTNDLGDEVRVDPSEFRRWLKTTIGTPTEDWAAAYGARVGEKITATPFHMMGGPQLFLAELRRLAVSVDPLPDFAEALYGPWNYAHNQNSYGWDPTQGTTYAYLARQPDKTPKQSVRGALWLLAEALPLFPTFAARRLQTTAFVRIREADEEQIFFQWPIWSTALGFDAVSTLVASDLRPAHRGSDVEAVYRSQRAQPTKYYGCFRPATRM